MADTCVMAEQIDDKTKVDLVCEAVEMIGKLTDAQLLRIMAAMKNDRT